MNNFVLITPEKVRLLISETEYKAYLKALNSKAKFIMIQQSLIPLQVLPTVFPFDTWYANENERLAMTGKRLCKLCLCIMSMYDSCPCWSEKGRNEAKNAFKQPQLPESVKKLLPTVKRFPQIGEIEEENVLQLKEKFL